MESDFPIKHVDVKLASHHALTRMSHHFMQTWTQSTSGFIRSAVRVVRALCTEMKLLLVRSIDSRYRETD